MHYHLEIIMPPTDDVRAAVIEIMAQFDENGDPNDEDYSPKNTFWDFWNIGGRWGGAKVAALLGADRIRDFRQLLAARHFTVSGLQFGKPTLEPADQRPAVDALWNEHFADAPMRECPLFDYYKGDFGDVMPFAQTPMAMSCSHVIFAAPNYSGEKLEATYMVTEDCWNGVNHQKTTWDQTLAGALTQFEEKLSSMNPAWADKRRPAADWLCVTIDYHS